MEASSLAYIDTEYGVPSMEHYVDSLIEQVRRDQSVNENNTVREALSLRGSRAESHDAFDGTTALPPATQTTASCACTTCV